MRDAVHLQTYGEVVLGARRPCPPAGTQAGGAVVSESLKPRPVSVIAHEAYEEILARRESVRAIKARAQQEEQEADQLVEALGGYLQANARPLHVLTAPPVATKVQTRGAKPGELRRSVLTLVTQSLDRLSRDQIATQLQHNGKGLTYVLNRCVREGELDQRDGCYGLPSPIQ